MSTNQADATVQAYARLLSLAVHELRTPASVIGGYLRMLRRDAETPPTDRQLKMIDEAERSCARIVELISELGEISKLDAGTPAPSTEPFDLFAVVAEMAEGVHEARDRGVELQLQGDTSGAPMRGDRPQIGRAFAAFCRAILREQPRAGVVAVDRRRDADNSAVVVIAPLHDVQQAYGSRAGAFNERHGGLGLALPIARRIVERHGGRVWSSSRAAGDTGLGAIVVTLPLSERSP